MAMHIVVSGYLIYGGKILLILHNKLKVWLPVGGHIEENETPDDAVAREFKEEVGIDVELLNRNGLGITGDAVKELATPFHVNLHNVGNHDHCCLYYLCRPKGKVDIKMLESEISGAKWFSLDEIKNGDFMDSVKKVSEKAIQLNSEF